MASLNRELHYLPAKRGDRKAATQLLKIFSDQLVKSKNAFDPVLVEYVLEAIDQIQNGEDAGYAFLLKRKGQGNKADETNLALKVGKEVELRYYRKNRLKKTTYKSIYEEMAIGFWLEGRSKKIHLTKDTIKEYFLDYRKACKVSD